jgi:tetratricopeptide (TPR) repeat protein
MDCRTSMLVGFGLSFLTMGCISQPLDGTTPPPPALFKFTSLPKEGVMRPAHPQTCVAWGVCRERQAELIDLDNSARQNLYDEARKAYQEALRVDSNYLPAQVALARIYMKMNRYDRALATYKKALQKYPKDPSLLLDYAICQCRQKDWDSAIAALRKALESDPENRKITQTLGFCLARAGQIQESLAILNRVMTPDESYCTLARMMHHVHQDELSRQYLQQALQINPNLAQARWLQDELDGRVNPAPDPSLAHLPADNERDRH